MSWIKRDRRAEVRPSQKVSQPEEKILCPFARQILDSLPKKSFFRRDEIAAIFDVHVNTVKYWVRTEQLHEVTIGEKTVRIPLFEIQRFVIQHVRKNK